MPSWSALPTDLRGEIVKRLDFRTRFRFRHVSKSNQELVDSVPLYIPRVVLEVKCITEAKLRFWMGIEERIDVTFVNTGREKAIVKVTEVSKDKTTQRGATRQIVAPSAPMLALAVFRNVTMNPDTLSGAIELNNTQEYIFESADARAFFGDRKLRTKVVCTTYDVASHLMSRVSEVEEVRMWKPNDVRMNTTTKRLRVRIDGKYLTKFRDGLFAWRQFYFLATKEERELVFPVAKYRCDTIRSAVKLGDDDYFSCNKKDMDHGPVYQRNNSCGVATWDPPVEVELEDPTACAMRWACPIHADPFDHWYNTRDPLPVSKEQDKVLFELFEKETFQECVIPVVNGWCQMEQYLELCARESLEEKKRREFEKKMERLAKAFLKKPDNQWNTLIILAFISLGFGLIAHWLLFA